MSSELSNWATGGQKLQPAPSPSEGHLFEEEKKITFSFCLEVEEGQVINSSFTGQTGFENCPHSASPWAVYFVLLRSPGLTQMCPCLQFSPTWTHQHNLSAKMEKDRFSWGSANRLLFTGVSPFDVWMGQIAAKWPFLVFLPRVCRESVKALLNLSFGLSLGKGLDLGFIALGNSRGETLTTSADWDLLFRESLNRLLRGQGTCYLLEVTKPKYVSGLGFKPTPSGFPSQVFPKATRLPLIHLTSILYLIIQIYVGRSFLRVGTVSLWSLHPLCQDQTIVPTSVH